MFSFLPRSTDAGSLHYCLLADYGLRKCFLLVCPLLSPVMSYTHKSLVIPSCCNLYDSDGLSHSSTILQSDAALLCSSLCKYTSVCARLRHSSDWSLPAFCVSPPPPLPSPRRGGFTLQYWVVLCCSLNCKPCNLTPKRKESTHLQLQLDRFFFTCRLVTERDIVSCALLLCGVIFLCLCCSLDEYRAEASTITVTPAVYSLCLFAKGPPPPSPFITPRDKYLLI